MSVSLERLSSCLLSAQLPVCLLPAVFCLLPACCLSVSRSEKIQLSVSHVCTNKRTAAAEHNRQFTLADWGLDRVDRQAGHDRHAAAAAGTRKHFRVVLSNAVNQFTGAISQEIGNDRYVSEPTNIKSNELTRAACQCQYLTWPDLTSNQINPFII